jgi:hypothetical protein
MFIGAIKNKKIKKYRPLISFLIISLSIIMLIYALIIDAPIVILVILILILKIIDLIFNLYGISWKKKININFKIDRTHV